MEWGSGGGRGFFPTEKRFIHSFTEGPREKILTSHSRGPRCGSCGAHASPPRPWRTTRGGRRGRRGRFSIGGSGGEDLRAILRRCDEGVVAHASDGGSSTTMTFWIGLGQRVQRRTKAWYLFTSPEHRQVPATDPCGRLALSHVNTHTPFRAVRPSRSSDRWVGFFFLFS